jgi:ClpP class serine protease
MFRMAQEQKKSPKVSYDSASGIAVLSVHGPLTYRDEGMDALCGMASYEGLLQQAADAIEAGVKTIVMDVDSGGGSAQGCFSTCNELRAMCDANGVSLMSSVDGSACSAAYAWACVADEIVADKYSEVGSIGVLISLRNPDEMTKATTYITDGADKVPFDKSGGYKESFLEELQMKATKLGDAFREHVSSYTGLTPDELKATQAKVYMATDALSMGMVNKIMTKSEFISYVVAKHKGVQDA